MSAPFITIQFTPQAKAVLAKMQAFPERVMVAIAAGVQKANELTVGHIYKTYLSFPKDKPSTLEGLRAQSNLLRQTLNATAPVISGETVTSSIGTTAAYARLHEFGGTFSRTQKAGIVRLRTDRGGNLLRQGKNGKLAVFAKNTHKRAKEVAHGGSTYTVTYPARRPIQRGIEDNVDLYRKLVSQQILAIK